MNSEHQSSPPTTCTLPSNTNSISKQISRETLCIGLDIAWFGGSKNDKDSQYDCLASVVISPDNTQQNLRIRRIKLNDRDPDSEQLLKATDDIIKENAGIGRIVFAIDAPIQAIDYVLLPRSSENKKGEVKFRCCEKYLTEQRKIIDKMNGGNDGWHPNIQPGAPLAPRVISLLEGLKGRGFNLWTHENQHSERLVIECFPSEAIWAAKKLGYYPGNVNATCVKAYKKQKSAHLSAEQVQTIACDVLNAFGSVSGSCELWSSIQHEAIDWLLNDLTWQRNGHYRGGKLLDDVIDTMICLSTSLSYAHGIAHVWHDLHQADDGHIIGPGFENGSVWIPACTNRLKGND